MIFDKKELDNISLIKIYKALLLPRQIEEKMLVLLRQGKISKWFSGIGQEAISVGATLAMLPDEWIMPLHRNLGVFTTREMPLSKLFMQWQGNKDGYSKGRERSFHFGSKENFICGMISHLGPQLTIANGVSLAYELQNNKKVSLTFTGDGGTSEGDFHEALNVAAVWNLPTIFIIENNGYGLSTPTNEQFKCEKLSDRALGYGMKGITIDGNNILEVYHTLCEARNYCIENKKPILIECNTFRMRGHEEASGTKYVPQELFDIWKEKDPLTNFEKYLLNENIITTIEIENIKNEFKLYIETSLEEAYKAEEINPNSEEELNDVYAPHEFKFLNINNTEVKKLRFVDAIQQGLSQSMETHENLILMGQDIAGYGGAFKITEGLLEKFGKERVRNTPLCESAIVGAALGLSLQGFKSMVEMQFADFVTVTFNQIVNNLAKIYYRWGQNADVVIRMPTGGGVGAGPFHSQSNEAWFAKVPGLKIVYPSSPNDAKGLLIAAINDPNPVLFFEHKALYRSITDDVNENYFEIEIGKANVVSSGTDISIITYGMGVIWAKKAAAELTNISIEILDLRSLLPLDYEAIKNTTIKNGKVLILHEDTLVMGIGAEISAWINENCFKYLDAPVMRCASLDTPIPFNLELEKNFMADKYLKEKIIKLVEY